MLVSPKSSLRLVIDTPNLVFSRNGIRTSNIIALDNFIRTNPRIEFYALITPKIAKNHILLSILKNMEKKSRNLKLFESEQSEDPDLTLLTMARSLGAAVLSNDLFRQRKYMKFSLEKNKRIGFTVKDLHLILHC